MFGYQFLDPLLPFLRSFFDLLPVRGNILLVDQPQITCYDVRIKGIDGRSLELLVPNELSYTCCDLNKAFAHLVQFKALDRDVYEIAKPLKRERPELVCGRDRVGVGYFSGGGDGPPFIIGGLVVLVFMPLLVYDVLFLVGVLDAPLKICVTGIQQLLGGTELFVPPVLGPDLPVFVSDWSCQNVLCVKKGIAPEISARLMRDFEELSLDKYNKKC